MTEQLNPQGWFDQWYWTRINKNKNLLVLVVGETGIGKSYWALRQAERLDSEFNISRVTFLPDQFQRAVEGVGKSGKPGVILFDEPQIAGLSHRNWQSSVNKMCAWFLQSSRFLHISVFFCLPSASLLDKSVRKICHALVIMDDRGLGVCYRIQHNNFGSSPEYYTYKAGSIVSKMPSKVLWEAYEEKRARFHKEFFPSGSLKVAAQVEKKRLADSIHELVMADLKTYTDPQGNVKASVIAGLHHCSPQTAYAVKNRIEAERNLAKVKPLEERA